MADRSKPRRLPRARAADALAGPAPKRGRCKAKTTRGARCKRRALEGALVCAQHVAPRRMGRPSKLEPATVDRILQILRAGGYLKVAVAAAGIGTSTFHDWMDRGDPDGKAKADAPFRDFRAQVEQARAEGETRNVTLVATAAQKDWKAAAWLLERQFPDRWAGPRGRSLDSSIHPDDFAQGEMSSGPMVVDDQLAADGRPL